MVWQSGQDDHGKLVDTNNQISYLTYDLYAYGTTICLNTSHEENDGKTTQEYQNLDKCLDHQSKEKTFTIADIIQDQQL